MRAGPVVATVAGVAAFLLTLAIVGREEKASAATPPPGGGGGGTGPSGGGGSGGGTPPPAPPHTGAANVPQLVQSGADLVTLVAGPIGAGDALLVSGPTLSDVYRQAIVQYQAAGAAGVSKVGPEIDSAGVPSITTPYTQLAWALNSPLQGVPQSDSHADAVNAQNLAKQMLDLYQAAIIAAGNA
jgi:hypothetical protein